MTIATRGRTGEPLEEPPNESDSVVPVSPPCTPETFPVGKLQILDEKISNPRWVVPVLPEQELECLLKAAIDLCKAGSDTESEHCQRFFREGLTISFTKILTDEAVNGWKYNIHHCILQSCIKVLELCIIKMPHDWFPLLDLLAMVLNPNNKFHTFNASRTSDTIPNHLRAGSNIPSSYIGSTSTAVCTEDTLANGIYAKPSGDPRAPRGWLVDLINKFGQMGGFDALLERFNRGACLIQQPLSQVTSVMSQSSDQSNPAPNIDQLALPTSDYSSSLPVSELEANKSTHISPSETIGPANLQTSNTPELAVPPASSPVDMQQSITAPATSMNTSSLLSENLTSSMNSNSPLANNLSLDNARLTLPVVHALLKPFGQCHELLTVNTITKYLMPILELVPSILESLSDDELKKEAKLESKNDCVGGIVRAARNLARRLNKQDGLVKELEMFRLKMILRLLQISSFNGKMNALNEINKVLSIVTSYPHRVHTSEDDLDWLTTDIMANWIKDNNVLDIVLRDSLHQPQYVEKLEKILRFLIKEHSLTLTDLDAVWSAQVGKHEAIVKNVHDLLAKLAWDFSAEQLDHLFECFQASWTTANKKQRERLLELIRRLAEDDKDGVMAHKVLMLFWTLAHSDEVSPEVLDQALSAHVKILDYSCSQERDAQKTVWLDKCVDELKSGDLWTLPALKLIRDICCLYEPSTNVTNHTSRQHQLLHRQEVIDRLQNQHSLVILVTNSLTGYMDHVRELVNENDEIDPNELKTDGRYNHPLQIQERLNFLRFLLKDGQLWLCADQAKQIWQCLAEGAVFPSDREACFRWFGKLMGEEPDLDPGINRDFFENNLLRLDPTYLSESGIKCFERFFKAVNLKEGKLKAKRRGFVLDDVELIGSDYLWRVITCSAEDIANRAIELLKEVTTSLGPRLQDSQASYHRTFIGECCERLKTHYDTVLMLTSLKTEKVDSDRALIIAKLNKEADRMCRVLKVIQEYVIQCDQGFIFERRILPLHRACRGKHMTLFVRFQNPGRPVDDIEIYTHSNDTVSSLRRQVLRRIKASASTVKLELFLNGEPLDVNNDRQTIIQTAIRDKTYLTGKLSQAGTGMASSPDSSSDSSTGSPPRPGPDQPRLDIEVNLPGVIISKKNQYAVFFLQLSELGVVLCHSRLRDSARKLLHLVPPDLVTIVKLQSMCGLDVPMQEITEKPNFGNMFFKGGVAQILYHLEVLQAVLLPSLEPLGDAAYEVQQAWVRSGVAHMLVELFTKNNFMAGTVDTHMKRAAYLCVLRLTKFFFNIVGSVLCRVGDEPPHTSVDVNSSNSRSHIAMLKQAIHSVSSQQAEQLLRSVATKISQTLSEKMLMADNEGEHYRMLFGSALQWQLPDLNTIRTIIRMAWAASTGSLHLLSSGQDLGKENTLPDDQDIQVCREALEVLTVSVVLNPSAHDTLMNEPFWSDFIINLVLVSESKQVRQTAAEQLLLISTWCSTDRQPLDFIITLLISVLKTETLQYAHQSQEYFMLICRLLNYAHSSSWPMNVASELLSKEISWLKLVRENVINSGDLQVHEALLEGHLCLVKELLSFLTPDDKSELGCGESSSIFLIKELVEDFLFPASKLHLELVRGGQIDAGGSTWGTVPAPVCRSPQTVAAACDLLVALCTGSSRNLKELVNMMTNMFYSDTEPLREWEYMPPVGPRPPQGFCGLKNAGATCYMNSVLQQLYMVHTIRSGLLSSMGAATDNSEDFSGEERDDLLIQSNQPDNSERINYHVGILKHVQAIFAHLAHSHLQFYVPRGLWSHFKLQGEPVNLREQQDAVEFFMSLVESLDEGLKGLGHPQLMGATLGGSYSDQKICRECPHRYSKEEPFSVISVDIRNHSSLADSLEQYVKGELLEGADAYHCDKCDKKVVTVKRLCVRKLPPVLAIQLKRFEYDFERVCAIKFNDYFEFPRELDMEPYTVSGLARVEGEVIDVECEDIQNPNPTLTNNNDSNTDAMNNSNDDNDNNKPENKNGSSTETKYHLSGIVVHSGQASGGHYYSYILHRESGLWYKFDDGDVTECKMDEDEEMKVQCFGGDYMGEIFDHMLKRMQYRRQKRWWNAYMLFYTRCDQPIPVVEKCVEQLSLAESGRGILKMPPAIERSVRIQNIKFLHSRNMYSVEYFTFIRKLVACNTPREKLSPSMEELSLLSIQLATRFLFHSGIKTKKSLRGSACEWYEAISPHLRYSGMVRAWFAWHGLLESRSRIAEYLLAAPSAEVRGALMKIIVFLAHFSKEDSPLTTGLEGSTLSEQLIIAVLSLLQTDISEHGKHLPHFFTLFHMYSSLGPPERSQLLQLNVPALFMQVAIDEGPGPAIKYMYPEFTKLHQVVAILVRCCDVSNRTHSANAAQGATVLPNPYGEVPDPLIPLEPMASEILFGRNSYLKKLIEDSSLGDDGLRLLQYCSWENPHFSRAVLTELLWQVAYAYCHELRHNTDLLLGLLLIEDSWQSHRIHNAIMGVQEEREGLLDTIQRSKTHYQKRAYHCIKCLVNLFTRSRVALALLHSNADLTRRWVSAVEWLHDELERRYPSYNTWSPPAHSNDSMSGYFLERSPSARNVLKRAFELCPTEDPEDGSEHETEGNDDQTVTSTSSPHTNVTGSSGGGSVSSGAISASSGAISGSSGIVTAEAMHHSPTASQSMPALSPVKDYSVCAKPDVVSSTECIPGTSGTSGTIKASQSVTFSQVLQNVGPQSNTDSNDSVEAAVSPGSAMKSKENRPATTHVTFDTSEEEIPVINSQAEDLENSIENQVFPEIENREMEVSTLANHLLRGKKISQESQDEDANSDITALIVEELRATTLTEISHEESKT